ncbi:hypothetical protein OA957_00255 [Prochlorococcus sp. AH-716-B04]|nr:hypothetical protein [Prochlorococcus sp. AH-716-B04]
MISISISFCFFIYIFSGYLKFSKGDDQNYVIFASSLIFSIASNGLIAMLLIASKTSYVPICLIQLLIFFIFTDIKKFKNFSTKILKKFLLDFSIIRINYGNFFIKLISFILICLLLVSFGPINHSDTVKYYVGYPFQYFIENSHFVDGDLGQGLLGIGDFANLSYIQERSIWLIRVSQFLPIIPIILFLGKRKTSSFLILIFISSPVFIQWLSIGKITFLGDSCLSLIFLCWRNKPSVKYAFLTFCIGLISVAIKISSLLIFVPLMLNIFYFYRSFIPTFLFNKINSQKNQFLIFTVSVASLFSIMFYRFFLTGNFFFPLLSSLFNQGNAQLYDWEMMLRNFDRTGFYQLWLFFPKNTSKIGSILGPATGIFFLIKMIDFIKNLFLRNILEFNIGFVQLIFLLAFSQGRADYYFSPLLLLICGSNKLFDKKTTIGGYFKVLRPYNLVKFFLIIQIFLFLISSFYIVFLNFYTMLNYEVVMDKTAYGYYNSKLIQEKAKEPVLGLVTSPSRLFYNKKFVPNHKYWNCFKYSEQTFVGDKQKYCFDKLKVNTIIVEKNYFKDNKNYICETHLFRNTPRNIFRSSRYKVDFCRQNKN